MAVRLRVWTFGMTNGPALGSGACGVIVCHSWLVGGRWVKASGAVRRDYIRRVGRLEPDPLPSVTARAVYGLTPAMAASRLPLAQSSPDGFERR